MLEINLSRDSAKFLKKLVPKHRRQIAGKILLLAHNPQVSDTQKLHGYEKFYRSDIGEYRVILRLSPKVLFIVLIGKRNDDEVYRKFDKRQR